MSIGLKNLNFVFYFQSLSIKFGKQDRVKNRKPDQGYILIQILMENRLRCPSGPVHFHRFRYINAYKYVEEKTSFVYTNSHDML